MNYLKISLFLLVISTTYAFSAYYDTLPKGVRALDLRNITANNVKSSFNNSAVETPYSYQVNIDANIMADLPVIDYFLNEIKYISEDAYNSFSVGEYGIEAEANVNVNVVGLGWGLSDRLTAYFGVPFYQAEVNINYRRVKGDNHDKTLEELHKTGRSDVDGLYADLLDELRGHDVNGAFLQSVVVDQLGYKPVGKWVGHEMGDTEVGMIYRLTNLKDRGASMALGVVLPTGYVEDPSIIQDISFGDGQTDYFAELGGGFYISDSLTMNGFIRYTYQAEGERALRVPQDEDFTLSDQIGNFKYKLGNKVDINLNSEYQMNDWLGFRLGYELNMQGEARYTSLDGNEKAESILEQNTDTIGHNVRLATTLSTVTLFKKKKFMVPGSIDFSMLDSIGGRNIPKVTRYEVQFRMFF